MGSRASGVGSYDGTSAFFLRQSFAVPAGAPQSYVYNFFIQAGELGIYCSDCSGGGSATFSINIGIDLNNDGTNDATLATMMGELTVDGNGVTDFTQSASGLSPLVFSDTGDQALSSTSAARSISWSDTVYSLSLGAPIAGDTTFVLSYDMITRATGAFNTGTTCVEIAGNGYGDTGYGDNGYGQEFAAFATEGRFVCGDLGNTIARSGDPGNLRTDGASGITLASVPEPGTGALIGLGFAAGAFVSRRRRR
jgi:hypothetical protein